MASLNVWMNGELVGEWVTLRSGAPLFRYTPDWTGSRNARPLSLSLPITADREIRGAAVENYFDNLLPDSADIRRRIRSRFNAQSMSAFDLLTAVGRDCVGAVQLLPPQTEPSGWNRVEGKRLTETDIERLLQNLTAPALGRAEEIEDDFRISIAGAQEKTALLLMAGRWFLPGGATPTTHILKLPLGLIGGFRGDFSDSVENEWLCAQVLGELGLPVATSEIMQFGTQKALSVTRFDRRWIGVEPKAVRARRFVPARGVWIARLPQEDFCQATGLPPSQKYEADGGPSIEDSLALLAGSQNAEADKSTFVLAQLAFWLLAATDGHGKNFSLHHLTGGSYRMTPLYDVLSAWPIIGPGAHQLAVQRARLAMALPGRRRHYRLNEIQVRHWQSLATRTGVTALWDRMCEMVASVDAALGQVEKRLPAGFPERVFARISAGMRRQARQFGSEVADSRRA